MALIKDLRIGMSVSAKGLEAGLKGAEARLSAFARTTGATRSALASFAGGMAAVGGAMVFGRAASAIKEIAVAGASLNAIMSKTSVIFGDATSIIMGDADQLAGVAGVIRSEFINAATSFGSVFKGLGKSQSEAAKLGTSLAKLGLDMASFEGVANQEAFTAISSALRGEFDPIERFRVFLTADKIAAEALSSGLVKTKGEITEFAKKQATLNLILRQTADAQGDLTRTLMDADNQMKGFSGRVVNLREDLGMAFRPITEAVSRLANTALAELTTSLAANKEAIKAWATEAASGGGMIFRAFEMGGKALGTILDIVHTLKIGFVGLQAEVAAVWANVVKSTLGAGMAIDTFLREAAGVAPRDFSEEEYFIKALGAEARKVEKTFHDLLVAPPPSEKFTSIFDGIRKGASASGNAVADVAKKTADMGKEMSAAAIKVGELETKLRAEIAAFGQSSEAADIHKLKLAGATDAELKAVKALSSQLEGKRLQQDTMKPAEKFQKEMARLNALREPGNVDFETYKRGVVAARKDFHGAVTPGQTHGAAVQMGTQEAYAAQVRAVQGTIGDEPIKDVAKNTKDQVKAQKKQTDLLQAFLNKLTDGAITMLGLPGT